MALAFVDVGADNEVGNTGFIFEGDEENAVSGAGPLPDERLTGYEESASMRAETLGSQVGSAYHLRLIQQGADE